MTTPRLRVCLVSWWVIAAVAGTGCDALLGKEPNPGYCASPPCTPPDTGGCRSNADCASPGAGVCDAPAATCVQCTAGDHAACAATTPVCGTDNACRGCAAHGECPSNACAFADGSCAAASDVAYVDATGADNAACDRSAPCASVAAALMTGRSYVKLHGAIDGAVVVDKGRTVTFLAEPGATLTRTGGDVLTVKDTGTSLVIFDLAITGAQGPAVGISVQGGGAPAPALSLMRATVSNNVGGGISAATGSLAIDHSTIAGNGNGNSGPGIVVTSGSLSLAHSLISGNHGGGVTVTGSAKFAIVSNKFVSNGAADSSTGAVNIAANFATANLLEFNTFYKNLSTDGVGSAIQCIPSAFTASNNIMFRNGTATNLDQTTGSCLHTYSIAMPGTALAGAGDLAKDPLFVDPANGDLHLQTTSPAIRAADPSTPLTGPAARDFDDRPRMAPANLGAYQTP